MKSKIEIEAKIKVNKKKFIEILRRIGTPKFSVQINHFFQNRYGEIIRLRCENKNKILTRKIDRNDDSQFKIKKEEEIKLMKSDILKFFGYKKFFSYKKQRAYHTQEGCMISLDKLGKNRRYIEIEGVKKNIQKVIKKFTLMDWPIEKKSYLEILGGIKWSA